MNIEIERNEDGGLSICWLQREVRSSSYWDWYWILIPAAVLLYLISPSAHNYMGPPYVVLLPFLYMFLVLLTYLSARFLLSIGSVTGHDNFQSCLYGVACIAIDGEVVVTKRRITRLNSIIYLVARQEWLFALLASREHVMRHRWGELLGFSLNTSAFHASGNASFPTEQIVLADLGEGSSRTVCVHYGAQSEVAELRAVLQRELIGNRPRAPASMDPDDPI